MEILARKIAQNIANSLSYENEQEQVIAYGLIAIIQILVTLLLVIILGIFFKVLPEALIVNLSVVLLRKYSGGTHAHSIELCTITSVFYSLTCALLSKMLLTSNLNIYTLIVIEITTFIISYYVIFKYAPIDSPNKPIKTETKIKRMRKGSFIVLTLYLIISILFIYLSFMHTMWSSYYFSLLFGIIWQVSTLTKISAFIAQKIKF